MTIREVAQKIMPSGLYLFVASKIYFPLWEMAWRLGLVEATLGDVCRCERAAEYPWVLRNVNLQSGKILDIGCKGSLFPILFATIGFEVWGIDLADFGRYKSKHPNFRFIKGDVRTASLPEDYFDVITAISTMEHVGLEDDGDIDCMKRLARLLKKDGKVIITIPFGEAAQFDELRIYSRERITKLFKGWKIEKMDFFKELEQGKWLPAEESEVQYFKHTSKRVRSIVCIMAIKNT